ncbi:separin [Colletotrichum salicis]|uniref:Separin n=1 Tax=Colletotrichum salicis TaxID=1209931 RepID=A0A135U9Q3_9PEZI|nr:separin [Colletotrichum salicis]
MLALAPYQTEQHAATSVVHLHAYGGIIEVTLWTLSNTSRGATTGVNDEQVVTKMAKLTLKTPATRKSTSDQPKPAVPMATRKARTTKKWHHLKPKLLLLPRPLSLQQVRANMIGGYFDKGD